MWNKLYILPEFCLFYQEVEVLKGSVVYCFVSQVITLEPQTL